MSGSIYGAAGQGRSLATIIGQLGYRAFLPGNHDFDYCPETNDPLYYFNELLPLARLGSPDLSVLALDLTYQGRPLPGTDNLLIVNDEPRVVLVGVPCPLTHRPSLGPILNDFDFGLKPTLTQTKEALLTRLRELLAPFDHSRDQVIVLAHLGANARGTMGLSGQMALDWDNCPLGPDLTEIAPVAAVVDGHTHEVVAPHRPRGQALYANLGQGLNALAEITIINEQLTLELKTYEDLMELEPDPSLNQLIQELETRLGLTEKLLTLPVDAPYSLDGLWETIIPMGQMVVEAMALKADSQLAFLNKGALRAGLSASVTVGSLHQALPFNDQLFKSRLPGQTILDLLRQFSRKGFRGFPLIHGLSLWAYPSGQAVGLAGVSCLNNENFDPRKTYTLALSGQMARLLAGRLPHLENQGTIVEAVLELIRARANQTFLHTPNFNHYRLFENQDSAALAFQGRLDDPFKVIRKFPAS
jgi:2',3'-cyclic-nucleotide 2'-phosphodiesterase (5'-nucleotidase family)